MKNSKNMLLLAATMATANIGAVGDLNTIELWDNVVLEFSGNDTSEDKNIFRQLARNCGDENFEMGVKIRFKPFAITQEIKRASGDFLPIEAAAIGYAMQKEADLEQKFDEAVEQLKILLLSTDEHGKNAIDLVVERKRSTGCSDCVELKKIFKALKKEIKQFEREEQEKKEIQ